MVKSTAKAAHHDIQMLLVSSLLVGKMLSVGSLRSASLRPFTAPSLGFTPSSIKMVFILKWKWTVGILSFTKNSSRWAKSVGQGTIRLSPIQTTLKFKTQAIRSNQT